MPKLELAIENYVQYEVNTSLLLGKNNEDMPSIGWQYDIKRLENTNKLSTAYTEYIDNATIGIKEGTIETEYQSGVITGIKHAKNIREKRNNKEEYIPLFETGSYAIYDKNYNLYSDYSVSAILNPLDIDSYTLHKDAKHSNMEVAFYLRDKNGIIKAIEPYSYCVGDFDGYTNQYRIVDNKIELNNLGIKSIGTGTSLECITETWEEHKALPGGTICLNYLNPITITLAVVDSNDNITILNQVSSLLDLDNNESGYEVFPDLGLLFISGKENITLFLERDVSYFDTTIHFHPDVVFESLPASGTIRIENELISYESKGKNCIEKCIRGVRNTLADRHTKGTRSVFRYGGKFIPGKYYVKYDVGLRIDYEISNHNMRRANYSNWLNLNPMNHISTNKTIQLVQKTDNVAKINLTTNADNIGSNLFGPIYYGTDVATLEAEVLDSSDMPVESILTTIYKKSGNGFLDYFSTSITKETNSDGKIRALYNIPYTDVEILIRPSSIRHLNGHTFISVTDLPNGCSVNDIYLYQILKQDPSTGTSGKRVTASSADSSMAPWGNGYFDCNMVYTEDFDYGILQIVYSGVRYTFTIKESHAVATTSGIPQTRIYVNEYKTFMNSGTFTLSDVWLYQKDAISWDSALLNGCRVLVYEWSENYINPKSKSAGAYGPLRPTNIRSKELIFENVLLPIPAPHDITNNLGGYAIIAPSESKFQAYCTDPLTSNIIRSNELRFKIDLPPTLKGIEENNGLPIPYGFTFITDEFNIGSSLGGANFITINANASAHNQITFKGII